MTNAASSAGCRKRLQRAAGPRTKPAAVAAAGAAAVGCPGDDVWAVAAAEAGASVPGLAGYPVRRRLRLAG